jgi:hypothetical protein
MHGSLRDHGRQSERGEQEARELHPRRRRASTPQHRPPRHSVAAAAPADDCLQSDEFVYRDFPSFSGRSDDSKHRMTTFHITKSHMIFMKKCFYQRQICNRKYFLAYFINRTLIFDITKTLIQIFLKMGFHITYSHTF